MIIAHLADLHLGFRAYHRSTADGFNVREADVAAAFRAAVDRTISLRPDLVLVAGDVFHSVRPTNAAIGEAFRGFSRLASALPTTPIVMVAGASDSPRSRETGNILNLLREIPGTTVVVDEVERVQLDSLRTSVLCAPHAALARADRRSGDTLVLEPDPDVPSNILLLHGAVRGGAGVGPRHSRAFGGVEVPVDVISPARWTYVALGHHHRAMGVAPNAWYSGSIEYPSTQLGGKAGERGFISYDTGTREATFHPLSTRQIVDLGAFDAAGLTAAEVDERMATLVGSLEGGLEGKLVRLVIEQIPRPVVRELSHRLIREYKARALHFELDVRPPRASHLERTSPAVRRPSLEEQLQEYLTTGWRLSSGEIERERLVALGGEYLSEADVDTGEF